MPRNRAWQLRSRSTNIMRHSDERSYKKEMKKVKRFSLLQSSMNDSRYIMAVIKDMI